VTGLVTLHCTKKNRLSIGCKEIMMTWGNKF
jgi:hypothetical protein